jgi:hypothetical protein
MIDLPEAELKATEERLLKELRLKVKRGLFNLSTECLSSLDLTILSALGVDVEAKLLQIFLEESTRLFPEK